MFRKKMIIPINLGTIAKFRRNSRICSAVSNGDFYRFKAYLEAAAGNIQSRSKSLRNIRNEFQTVRVYPKANNLILRCFKNYS